MTPGDLKLTPPGNLNAEQKKAWDAYYEPRNEAFKEAKLEGKDLVRWKYNRYMHDYLGCVKAVDESVGRVLEYLDDEGLAENTIVVYASDQGFYLGEHGWFDKRWIFEESLRTPLRGPLAGRDEAGQRRTTRSSAISTSPRRSSTPPGCRYSEGHAGPQPDAAAEGRDARRLAEELLLPLLRISPAPTASPGTTASSPTATSSCASTSRASTTGNCST